MSRVRAVLLGVMLMVVGISASAQAQSYTLAPYPVQYFTDGAAVCNGCLLNAYLSGTSTRRDTYSDTSGTANANPVVLNSAGRATVYLAVGVSYRLVLTNSTGGTTYFDVDPVSAVPSSAGNVDLSGTAGEALALGEVAYLSDGSGSTTAGRWYRADADNTYSSSTAGAVGIATAAIASAGTGTIRIVGRMTGLSGLTAGELYYASATAGALTATPPTNQRFIGEADTTTTLILSAGAGAVKIPDSDGTHVLSFITTSNLTADRRITILPGDSNRQITLNGDATLNDWFDQSVKTTSTAPSFNAFRPPQGRCTLTTATPVTTADVTAATTLYYALYGGNQITLYDGSTRWVQTSFAQLSIAVPATTDTMYDVFVDYTAGVPALEAVAWTNDTTRATALATQNGVYVQTSDTDSLYVCSFRTTGVSGQTEDSFAKRYVWNYYNRIPRGLRRIEPTDTWTYSSAAWQQANASADNQVDIVVGVAEVLLEVEILAAASNNNANIQRFIGIGEDSVAAPLASQLHNRGGNVTAGGAVEYMVAMIRHYPAVGRHYYTWLEYSAATATTTWRGDNGDTALEMQMGMVGSIQG